MQSKRQPKVHTYSKKRRRKVRPGRAILSIGFTFLVAGVIGVVGYSVAKPILQYSGAEHSQTQPEETLSSAVAETALPEESASAAVTETTAASVQTQTEDGYVLPVSALESKQALQAAAVSAREKMPDGKLLVIPLKVSGGEVWYQTSASLAKSCGAAKGSMTLSEIVDTVTQQGWTPVAQLSLLWDNLLPDADAAAGYRVTDGSRWLDNTKENGGKAWASPFSTVTVQYLTEITGEVSRAGFSQIWCKDAVFPDFRESDLNYIGESVQNPERSAALVQLVNQLAQTAGNVPLWVEVDAADAAEGTAEVFQPDTLHVSGVVLDLAENAAQAKTLLPQIKTKAGDLPLCLTADAGADLQELKAASQDGAGVFLSAT